MSTSRLSFAEAKKIPITDFLARSGFEPTIIRGDDHWYRSPFRDERTPSFKVNTKLNVWYDHGTGEGGTILDLGAKLNQCTLVEFLAKLSEATAFSIHRQPVLPSKPENTLEVLSGQALQRADLLFYLKGRGISKGIANEFCEEINFRIRDRAYKAIGFPNRAGGWELRNSWFKGSSAPKDISLINRGSEKIAVLEGFMDFLSLEQSEQKAMRDLRDNSDFLILNSLALLIRAIPILQSYKEVNLLLDNDLAAGQAKMNLKEKGIQFNDRSPLYAQHKDVNEFLVASQKAISNESDSQRRSRKIR